MFVAYAVAFRSGPGHVLLDATADVSGFASMMSGVQTVEVPRIDYRHLQTFHIEQPKAFKWVTKVVETKETAEPYAEWIKETLRTDTKPGDEVLIVVHNGLLKHGYIPKAENPDEPWLFEGRRINVLHWGVGIGSNKYGHIDNVFLFSEHFIPKRTTFVDTNFYRRSKVTEGNLRAINAPNLTGDYKRVADGHLLKWLRQLAARGSIRNIDGDGVAAPMRLFMTGDFDRVVGAWPNLFPNAPAPKMIRGVPKTTEEAKGALRGTDGVIRLLATSPETELLSDMIQSLTGVRTLDLSRTIKNPRVQAAMVAYGWTYEAGKGRGRLSRFVRVQKLAA
jgi:hypothetical protein